MNLKENGELVHALVVAFRDGSYALHEVPMLVIKVCEEDRWSHFIVKSTESLKKFKSFEEFVTHPLPEGMGTTLEAVKKVCKGDVKAERAIINATTKSAGNPTGNNQYTKPPDPDPEEDLALENEEEEIILVHQEEVPFDVDESGITDNVSNSKRTNQHGNSRADAIRKLEKDAPELLEKVEAGELSAHAAMCEAGFRKRPTPLDNLQKAWKKASEEEKSVFLAWIEET